MSIWGEEKTPCAVEPEEAFHSGMTLREYVALEHGRLHNQRVSEFQRILARYRAKTVTNASAPATRADIALLIATLYEHHAAYSHCVDDMKKAEGYRQALLAMGGKL